MAKFGSFKFGPGNKFGAPPVIPEAIEILSDRITTGGLPGVLSLSDKYFYAGDSQSLSTTYVEENISLANNSMTAFDDSNKVTLETDISLKQIIGNPILINNAGSRFSR